MAKQQATPGLPKEVRDQLQALGVPIKAWDPREIRAVLEGHRTLGELLGVSKERQLELATTGLKLLKDGLRDKAKEIFEGLGALDPYDAYVQVCLGTIAVEDEDFDLARSLYDRALTLNPASGPGRLMRAELHIKQGRKAEALADLEVAVKSKTKGDEDVVARAKVILEAVKKAK